jgi:hypothetical protein
MRRHQPLPHLVVSIPAEHQPKEAEAVAVVVVTDPTVGREDSPCFEYAEVVA